MKNALRKNIIILFAIFTLLGVSFGFSLFGGAMPIYAEPTDICNGEHGAEWTEITESSRDLSSGKYYLTENTKLTGSLTIAEGSEVTLCLNGYILCGANDGASNNSVITVGSGALLNVCDCKAGSAVAEHQHDYTVDLDGLSHFTNPDGSFLTAGSGNYLAYGGVITGGKTMAMNVGGGITVGNNANVVMTGGTISGNSSYYGGGVNCGQYESNATFTLNGGKISYNTAVSGGGGVYGRFIMNGGEISRNTAVGTSGGGVWALSAEINGGTISFNDAGSGNGGGVCNQYGPMTVTGGEIMNNIASNGGGVCTYEEFTMTGGSICYNMATDNGGGLVLYETEASFSGGVISHNTINPADTEYKAGGIYIYKPKSDITLRGDPVVFDNYVETGSENLLRNVCFAMYSKNHFVIDGPLTDGASIGISSFLTVDGGIYALTSGFDAYNRGAAATDYFLSDDNHKSLCIKDGEVAVVDGYLLTLNLYKRGDQYVVDTAHATYKYSEGPTVLPVPTRGGYVFEGWYENADYSGTAVTEIAAGSVGDKTFYAKWRVVPQNDLFGGEQITFGKNNIFDCQRSPAFPLGETPFYVFGLSVPLDVTGRTVSLAEGDYVKFEPYSGDGDGAVDADGNGVITVDELTASDRDRIVDTLYDCSNATSEQAILDAVVVSEIKYNAGGTPTALANIGLIWALGEEGFLYTALDPDCPWSYSGGVGTFITFKSYDADDGLSYTPDSPDPFGKENLSEDENGEKILPVPTPDKTVITDDFDCAFGIVVDQNDNPLPDAWVTYIGKNYYDTVTDGNGNFLFNHLGINEWAAGFDIAVQYGDYAERTYYLTADGASIAEYGIIRLVYPLNDAAEGSYSNDVTARIAYMNMDGASFGGDYPVTYIQGVGTTLPEPTKQCFAFGGWYESADFAGVPVTEISSGKTGDVTLYAKWTVSHTWGDPVFTWTQTEDGWTVEAKFTCAINAAHTETLNTVAVKSTVAPTCTDKGSVTFTATVTFNGQDYTDIKTTEVPALGHSFGEFTVTKQPTCTEAGEERRVCSHDETHIETRPIPALGHSFGEFTVTKPATPDADGEETRTCSVCGETETRAVKYTEEAASLLWLIIVLAVVLAAEIAVLIYRIRVMKKKNRNVGVKSVAALPLLSAVYPAGEIVAVAVLATAVVAVGIAIACTFVKKKKEENAAEEPKSIEPPTVGDRAEEPKTDETVEPEASENAAVETELDDEEELTLENEVAAELDNEGNGESINEGISLKESLALAAGRSKIKIDKRTVAEWLNKNFGGDVTLNRRANKTKTGLPLADTHYVDIGAKKKCFIYVYELDGDKSMLLLKTDDETAKEIADKYPMFVRSRFPKARREKWYTLVPDESFGSADEVFDVIALVISRFTENLRAAGEEVRREIARLEAIKKSNITVEEAKTLVSDAAAVVLVSGRKNRKTGKKFAVNIDTLSVSYDADDTVDLQSLKEKGLVPKSAKQVKILARGLLDKPLNVVADDFSADAVKMIVLTGGEAQWA